MNTDTPIHRFFAAHIAKAHANGKELREVFAASPDDTGILTSADNWGEMPLAVKEAWAFYDTFVMDSDWGSVGVHSVDADSTATVVVWTRDDGARCWLEVYTADDGAFIGAARASDGKMVWLERDTARAQVFTGEIPAELDTA